MNVLHPLLPRAGERSVPLLLAGTLLILGIGQAGTAAFAEGISDGRRPNPARREVMQRQQVEAIAKLSSQQRQAYFAARRQLEQRVSVERLEQLSQAERCMVPARDVDALQSCQRSLQDKAMEQRRRWMTERAELQRRFGLPGWGKEAGPSAQ
jgi:hypothetical protein